MSNTIAKVYCFNDRVIPLPFDFTPSEIEPNDNKDIIVSFFDCLDISKKGGDVKYLKNINKIYDYYGIENCKEYIGFMPYQEKKQHVFCVSSSYLLNKIKENNDFPASDLSPLWTKERYGITAEEAYLALSFDENINKQINSKKAEYAKILKKLKININREDLNKIKEYREKSDELTFCEGMELSYSESILLKSCRYKTTQTICNFLTENLPIDISMDLSTEPIFFFSVKKEIPDEEAIIIGNAVELLFNSIDPEDAEQFFNEFVFDICYWPIVINKTFDCNGERIYFTR